MKRFLILTLAIIISICLLALSACGANNKPKDEQPIIGGNATIEPTENETKALRYVADGKTIAVLTSNADGEASEPKVPEKVGYSGVWELAYEFNGNKTINAVYQPIIYTIDYCVVKIDEATGNVELDYKGTFDEFWRPLLKTLSDKTSVTEYTIESEDIIFDDLGCTPKVDTYETVYLVGFYTNPECTQKFSGVIPHGSTGNINLFILVSSTWLGPF